MIYSKEDQALQDTAHKIGQTIIGNLPEGVGMISFVFRQDGRKMALAMASNVAEEHIIPATIMCLETLGGGTGPDDIASHKVADIVSAEEVIHYDNNGKPLLKN